jgi:hypothetical protein
LAVIVQETPLTLQDEAPNATTPKLAASLLVDTVIPNTSVALATVAAPNAMPLKVTVYPPAGTGAMVVTTAKDASIGLILPKALVEDATAAERPGTMKPVG